MLEGETLLDLKCLELSRSFPFLLLPFRTLKYTLYLKKAHTKD